MRSVKITLVLILTTTMSVTTIMMSVYLLKVHYGPRHLPRALTTLEQPQPTAALWARYRFCPLETEEVKGTEKLSSPRSHCWDFKSQPDHVLHT